MFTAEVLDWSDKTVAKSRHGFDEEGNVRGISEHLAQPHDDGVEPGVEIHESIGRPNRQAEFLAGDQLAGTLQQLQKYHEGLLLNLDADAAPAQFVCVWVQLICAEAIHRWDVLLTCVFRVIRCEFNMVS